MLKHRTKSEAVYDVLREQILSGVLLPDQRLTLNQLSTEFGVSLMPVREALMRLEREHLVDITPYKDARVAPLSLRDMRELLSVRGALEAHAITLAYEHEGVRLAEHLRQANRRFHRAIEAEDFAEANEANREFHDFIADRACNDHLRRLLDDVWSKCLRYRAGFRLVPGRGRAAAAEHEAIIAAIEAGETERMAILMRAHMDTAGREMAEVLEISGLTEAADR